MNHSCVEGHRGFPVFFWYATTKKKNVEEVNLLMGHHFGEASVFCGDLMFLRPSVETQTTRTTLIQPQILFLV